MVRSDIMHTFAVCLLSRAAHFRRYSVTFVRMQIREPSGNLYHAASAKLHDRVECLFTEDFRLHGTLITVINPRDDSVEAAYISNNDTQYYQDAVLPSD